MPDLSVLQPYVLHLPTPEELPWVPRPTESHHTFAAGLIFIAALITVEALAGEVWHRSMARRMLFPAILVFLGWGLVLVAFIEPAARVVHVTMGLPMIVGGWAEWRHRLGELDRKYADALIVPSLVLAGFDTAVFHTTGPTEVVVSHYGLALIVVVIAGLRLFQSAQPTSIPRSLLISCAIVVLAGTLWLDALLQTTA